MKKKLFGDRRFYAMALRVAMPIMIQNAITNFVNMLDNIMVGRVGALPMSGVAITNQLLFVYNLCVFGAISGAGIFTAQFYGAKDHEGVRQTFRYKLMICFLLVCAGLAAFGLKGESLISLYLKGEGTPEDLAATLAYGMDYLRVMLIGLVPFALSSIYSGTLRESGETVVPMVGGIAAVLVNLCLNYTLIFGHFGAPALGARGAAIATVISRFVELGIVGGWTHLHPDRMPFIRGAYRSLRVPLSLTKKLVVKGLPLLVNEALWSSSMALLNQSYSLRGLHVVSATNIASTISSVFNVSFLAMGSAVGIIIGQMLGAQRSREEIKDTDRKLIAFSVMICLGFGTLLALVAPYFPRIYKNTEEVKALASTFILIYALMMPFCAVTNAAYFTLRSGGKVFVTLLFDSVFAWCITVPLAYCLSRFTAIPIEQLFLCCQSVEVIKCGLGLYMLSLGSWIQNIVQ